MTGRLRSFHTGSATGVGRHRYSALFLLVTLLLASCAQPTAAPPTSTPLPTATPAPTATPTPLPPVPLTIGWPAQPSALEDITLRVELPGLAQRDPQARVRARVRDPDWQLWWEADLTAQGEGTYLAAHPLHLPLQPAPGDWWLILFVETDAAIGGTQTMRFQPHPVPAQTLGEQVPPAVTLHIPQTFRRGESQGDAVAGTQQWTGAAGEVGLWWVPGPDEPLTEDTARVVADATCPSDAGPQLIELEAAEWKGHTAYHFREQWPEGPAETLVVQGTDRWLYVLCIRALEEQTIPSLLQDIQASFELAEAE